LDIVENIDTKKVFTKSNLCWSYNNVQIKKKDELKTAFMILKVSFKPIVIYFRLISSLAMFQTMMNEILEDLINTGEVVSFIDNIIIGMEEKEGYDKVVEVVRRLIGNNLYVKPEKCKWKIREVRFLEVVIGSKEIKMEEEKVKGVLE